MRISAVEALLTAGLFANGTHSETARVIAKHLNVSPGELSLRKIDGGLTNDNYVLEMDGRTYFVRRRNPQNALLGASLEKEWAASAIAADAGLSPRPLYQFPEEGIMLSEFIEETGAKPNLSNAVDRNQFCDLVRKIHALPARFPEEFCPFRCIEAYVGQVEAQGGRLPESVYSQLLPGLKRLESTIRPAKKVPCHLDLHNGNLLKRGSELYLVDWEYSAMANPFFDLATAASISEFSDREMIDYLGLYLERPPSNEEWNHFFKMRILADARWAIWCFLQDLISPIETSFVPYAHQYLGESLQRMSKLPLK